MVKKAGASTPAWSGEGYLRLGPRSEAGERKKRSRYTGNQRAEDGNAKYDVAHHAADGEQRLVGGVEDVLDDDGGERQGGLTLAADALEDGRDSAKAASNF